MPIAVKNVDGHTRIEGSETFPNGMTLAFYASGNPAPNCARLLDMKHARSWLAPDGGKPKHEERDGEPDMGGRGKTYNIGSKGAQARFTKNGKRKSMSSLTPAQAEAQRKSSGSSINFRIG